MTPDLAPYASEEVAFSRFGGRVACITASDDRLVVRVGVIDDAGRVGELRSVHHSARRPRLAGAQRGRDPRRLLLRPSLHGPRVQRPDRATRRAAIPGPSSGTGPARASSPTRSPRGQATIGCSRPRNASDRERALVWDVDSGDRRDLPARRPRRRHRRPRLVTRRPRGPALPDRPGRAAAAGLGPRAGRGPRAGPSGRRRARLPAVRPPRTTARTARRSCAAGRTSANRAGSSASIPRTGRETRTILASGEVPPGRSFRSVSFPSTDGTPLQAWLGVPDGEPPYPVVLETHGGPTAATAANFHPPAQAFLDEGFAVLSLNYRGSTTFGREFEQAIWGRLGELEIEDLAATHRWLTETWRRDPGPDPAHGLVVRRLPDAARAGPPAGPMGGRDGRRRDRRLGHELRGLERPPPRVPADALRRRSRRAR